MTNLRDITKDYQKYIMQVYVLNVLNKEKDNYKGDKYF